MEITLSLLDYLMIAYWTYHAFKGFKKGFAIMITETIAILLTLVMVVLYYTQISQWIQTMINISDTQSIILSFLLIVIVMFIISWIVTKLVSFMIKVSGLGLFNRIAGALVGCIKATCFMIPLILPLLWIQPELIRGSKLLVHIRQLIPIETQSQEIEPIEKIIKK